VLEIYPYEHEILLQFSVIGIERSTDFHVKIKRFLVISSNCIWVRTSKFWYLIDNIYVYKNEKISKLSTSVFSFDSMLLDQTGQRGSYTDIGPRVSPGVLRVPCLPRACQDKISSVVARVT